MADSVQQEKADFLALLADPTGAEYFMDYLKTNYTEHHLMFWREVQTYKVLEKTVESNADPIVFGKQCLALFKKQALEVFNKYIKAGTKLQINVTDIVKGSIEDMVLQEQKKQADTGEMDAVALEEVLQVWRQVFDESERVCEDLMKGNQYHPFMKTADYATWTKQKVKKSSACVLL